MLKFGKQVRGDGQRFRVETAENLAAGMLYDGGVGFVRMVVVIC